MSFGSFFTRAIDTITPWDRGGELERRRKREEEEQQRRLQSQNNQPSRLRVGNATPTQRVVVDNQPKPKQPENIFETLNKALVFNKPQNNVPVLANQGNKPMPQPGTVVQPTMKVTTAPAQPIKVGNVSVNRNPGTRTNELPVTAKPKDNRFWQKVGRGFKTAGQTIAGTVANVPEVGLAAGRAGTGLVQGVGELPHGVTALTATGTQQLQNRFNNPVTRQLNRGFQDVNTGVKKATHYTVNDTLDPLNRRLDETAKMYERNVPGATGGANVYRNTQIPLNILAVLATLGAGSAGDVGEVAGNTGKLGRVKVALDRLLNKPLSANEGNLVSKTGQSVINRVRPVAQALNTPVKSTRKGINVVRNLVGNRGIQNVERGAVDAGELGNLLTDAQATELATTQVPVSTGVSINQPVSEPVNIPVRNANVPPNLIKEVAGDVKTATTNAQIARNAINARRVAAAKKADTVVKPDRGIEGIKKPVPTYLGEAGGVTKVELEAERTMLDDALANKEITKTEHKAANKALDETVATDAPSPKGAPITVKEVNGIDVADQTNVPQNLPETPGQVRVTKATAPSNTKSEAVAAQPPVTTPKETPAVETPAKPVETLPQPDETDETFLKRTAEDMQTNIKRAVDSLKMTKKMTKAERAQRAAAGQKAYEEAKAAGKSIAEQESARKAAYSGGFDRMEYKGTPIHSGDEQRLRDMVDEHYKDMPYQAGNVREAFSKLFHSGEPGWQSETGNHIIPSDIKNIRKFLNESVPNPDGNGGLGDFADAALKELAAQETGPGRIANAIGLQRALRFTADISATGRQALPGALSHPVEFARAAKKSFEVMFSHEKYEKYVSSLANNKEANYINDRMGAYLSVLNDDISKADDIYRNSSWAHKIPIVRSIVAASERQYNTILSEMRRLRGQSFIDAAGGIGNLEKVASDSGDAEGFLKAIGTVSNVNTGRGFGKALDTGASKILSDVLVSPRGLAARIQRFNPKYYTDLFKANPAAGKEALRSLGIQTALTLSALAAANKAGMYEDGQIKVGNTRYDVTGGAANMVRTAVRVAQYMSGSRETTPFNNAEGEVTKWARNQLAPFLSSSLDAIGIHKDDKTGKYVNRWGEDVTLGSTILDNFAPVNASQVNNDLQLGTSPIQTAVNAGLNTIGLGVNTYQSSADKKAAGGPSNKTAKSGEAGTENYDTYKTEVPEEGYDLRQLDDGSYAYSLNGETHKTGSLKEAQQAIAKAGFTESGQNSKIIGDKHYFKNENGETQSEYKFKYEHDKESAKNTLDMDVAKDEENYGAWNEAATKQLASLEKLRDSYNKEGQEDEVDKTQLKIENLKQSMRKYKDYGGFKKGKKGKTSDGSFGTLKAGTFAPRAQEYASIDTKSGSIPHISVVRPNIVHQITAG